MDPHRLFQQVVNEQVYIIILYENDENLSGLHKNVHNKNCDTTFVIIVQCALS